jgi:hypothetical protein|tara:strand:+ start:654 stop:1052 length:399 start_codon:yes stop_codon:yes gene_type:complete
MFNRGGVVPACLRDRVGPLILIAAKAAAILITPSVAGRLFLWCLYMSDKLLEAVSNLQKQTNEIDVKIERLNAELQPFTRLLRGNGRPSLDARLHYIEQEVKQQHEASRWAYRTAAGAVVSAIAAVVVSVLK